MEIKFKRKNILLVLSYICVSCASKNLTEDERYLVIKSDIAQKKYNGVDVNIDAFERDFPRSIYLCEIWNIQATDDALVASNEPVLKQFQDKYKNRCIQKIDSDSNKK